MSSKKEVVYGYLNIHPKASNKELYTQFPDYSEGTIRVYRSEFLQEINQNITFNITQYKKESKKDPELLLKQMESVLFAHDLFPAYIFVKLYNETKFLEERGISDYSLIDMCEKLFLQIIAGKYDINEISDFSWYVNDELEKIYRDVKNTCKKPENVDIKRLTIRKKWESLKLISDIQKEIERFVYLIKREITKDSDKKKTILEIKDFIFARILNSYIFIDLYSIAAHLRYRDKKYIWRDLIKANIMYFQGIEINGTQVNNSIYKSRYIFDYIGLINEQIEELDDFELPTPEFYGFKANYYREFVSLSELKPTTEILQEKEQQQKTLINKIVKNLIREYPDLFTTNVFKNNELLVNKVNIEDFDMGVIPNLKGKIADKLASIILAEERRKEIPLEINELEQELFNKLEQKYNEKKRKYNTHQSFEDFEDSWEVKRLKEAYNSQIEELNVHLDSLNEKLEFLQD